MLTENAIRSGAPRSERQVGVIRDLGGGMRGEYMADGSFIIHVWFSLPLPTVHLWYRLSDDSRIRMRLERGPFIRVNPSFRRLVPRQALYMAGISLIRHKFAGAWHRLRLQGMFTLKRPDLMPVIVRIRLNLVLYNLRFHRTLMVVVLFAIVNLALAKFAQFLGGAEA